MTVYYSLIYSNLIYCISLWGGTWIKYIDPLFKVQKRFIRAISYLRRYDSTPAKFNELGILKLNNVYLYFSSLLIFKVRHQNYCSGLFERVVHNYRTRGFLNNMLVPYSRCKTVSKSFMYNVPKIWNQLPEYLKSESNLNSFKRRLKEYLKVKQSEL